MKELSLPWEARLAREGQTLPVFQKNQRSQLAFYTRYMYYFYRIKMKLKKYYMKKWPIKAELRFKPINGWEDSLEKG